MYNSRDFQVQGRRPLQTNSDTRPVAPSVQSRQTPIIYQNPQIVKVDRIYHITPVVKTRPDPNTQPYYSQQTQVQVNRHAQSNLNQYQPPRGRNANGQLYSQVQQQNRIAGEKRMPVEATRRPRSIIPQYRPFRGATNEGGPNGNNGTANNGSGQNGDCEAQITALFASNSLSVVVSGTKDISHVILQFCDETSQKFDDPKCGQSGTFSGTGQYAGKCISSAIVKCGCSTVTITSEQLADGCYGEPTKCTFEAPDCAGICGGPHIRDCAGICYNAETELPPSTYDCKGVCGGPNELDCAGTCFNAQTEEPPQVKDCAGVCGGNSVPDCKGFCGGDSVPDCKGICGGSSTADCKGVCGGNATYDCNGHCYNPDTEEPPHTRDCNGTCNGTAYRDGRGKCITNECVWNGKPVAFAPNWQNASQKPLSRGGRPNRYLPKNAGE